MSATLWQMAVLDFISLHIHVVSSYSDQPHHTTIVADEMCTKYINKVYYCQLYQSVNYIFLSHNLREHIGKQCSLLWLRQVVGCHIRSRNRIEYNVSCTVLVSCKQRQIHNKYSDLDEPGGLGS